MATTTTPCHLDFHSNPSLPPPSSPSPQHHHHHHNFPSTPNSQTNSHQHPLQGLPGRSRCPRPAPPRQPDALAAGGEFGILEGRSVALIHPIVMSGLFVYALWVGYLGWQWCRVRTIQDDINELKKQVKPPVTATVAVAPPPPLAPPSPVEQKIQQHTEERKALLKGLFRD